MENKEKILEEIQSRIDRTYQVLAKLGELGVKVTIPSDPDLAYIQGMEDAGKLSTGGIFALESFLEFIRKME